MLNKRLILLLSPLVIVVCTAFFIAGFLMRERLAEQTDNGNKLRGKPIRSSNGGSKFTNPLLECEVAEELDFGELTSFRTELTDLIQNITENGRADYISIYYRDLNNGPWFGINEKEEFSAASLLKVPIMISFLSISEQNPGILTTKLKYENREDIKVDDNPYFGRQDKLKLGQEYTVSELITSMIEYSDNIAAVTLAYNLSVEEFLRPYTDLGLKKPNFQSEYKIRVKDYATFFRILYNTSYLPKNLSEFALEILSKSAYKEGLAAGVPEGITVAHKFGEREIENSSKKQLHDCGIVYYSRKPYLLCIMTRGEDFEKQADVIKELSSFVYTKVSKQVEEGK